MKYIYSFFAVLFLANSFYSQVTLPNPVTLQSSGSILEFPSDGSAIKLPVVSTNPTCDTQTEASIFLNSTTNQIIWCNGTSNQQLGVDGLLTATPTSSDYTEVGLIIGSTTSSSKGALIIESTDKAVVLPRLSEILSIPNPRQGMMVYSTSFKAICIFDGQFWQYFSAQ